MEYSWSGHRFVAMVSSGPRILRGAVFIVLSPHGPSYGRSTIPYRAMSTA
jgi:hypothetical protein